MSTTDRPTRRTVLDIVAAATRAPSIHNSQPWRWRWDGERLDLYADWSRQVRYGDPDGRDLEISCGAALHHATTAAAGEGWHTRVLRTPARDDPSHLATVSFRATPVSPAARAAYGAVYRRHTDRRTPSSTPVPEERIDELVRIGGRHGTLVTPLHASEDQTLVRDLRQLSVLLQHDDERYLEELAHWTHSRGSDGVPDGSVLAGDTDRSRFHMSTRFPVGVLRDQPSDGGEPAPSWVLVATSSDDSMSRLRAGEALSAMLLRATALDLAVVPYTQAIEVDATRKRLEERILADGGCLQLLLRIAVPPAVRPRIPMTRRRLVKDVLIETEQADAHI